MTDTPPNRSPFRYLGLALLGLVLFTAVAWLGFFWFLSGSLCSNQVIQELPSPGAPVVAVVFRRDCGATTDFSTHVSIVPPASALPNRAGNVFAVDANHGAAPTLPDGGPEVRAEWVGPTRLRIHHHPGVRVFESEKRVRGVDVEYVTRQ